MQGDLLFPKSYSFKTAEAVRGSNMSYHLPFAEEYCPDRLGHHFLSQEKNVNDPVLAPIIPWLEGGWGSIMIAALQPLSDSRSLI